MKELLQLPGMSWYQRNLLNEIIAHAEAGAPFPAISEPIALQELHDILKQADAKLNVLREAIA